MDDTGGTETTKFIMKKKVETPKILSHRWYSGKKQYTVSTLVFDSLVEVEYQLEEWHFLDKLKKNTRIFEIGKELEWEHKIRVKKKMKPKKKKKTKRKAFRDSYKYALGSLI